MIRSALLPLFAVIVACETDIRLGDLPADAATPFPDAIVNEPDANAPDAPSRDAFPPDSGDAGVPDLGNDAGDLPATHDFEVFGQPDVMCIDALAGQESNFRTLTTSDVGFSPGSVAITRTSSTSPYDISGPTIRANFGVSHLILTRSPEDPGVFGGVSYQVSGSGPLGTRKNSAVLFIDETNSVFPSLSAIIGMEYVDDTSASSCFVVFPASMSMFL